MSLKFRRRKFLQPYSYPRNLRNFSTSKILGYTVDTLQISFVAPTPDIAPLRTRVFWNRSMKLCHPLPPPNPDEMTPFDLSAITPGSIKRVLAKRSSNSSPGEDGITYHHLKTMPSTHHFLATLFSKILLENTLMVWGKNKVRSQGERRPLPANFRPIALTSVVGKLYHKIIALHLEWFILDNNVIDANLQKGFLTGINGTMEHIFSKCSPAWPTPRHDLLGPGKCFWLCLTQVDLGYAVTLQITSRGHLLHHKPLLKADCICEDKEEKKNTVLS